MKTKIIYAILAVAILNMASCSRDEKSLFDKNPTERANEAMDNILTTLPAASNGWDMVYFANPDSEGYHVLVKFGKDGRATVAAKNDLTTRGRFRTDSTSVWEVMLDYGPILTFNTYNNVMHAWADPQDDGLGYEGDYEFLILETTPELIRLKGKKHSAYCYLRPIKDGIGWEDALDELAAKNEEYLGNYNLLVLNKDGRQYNLQYAADGIFALTPIGEEINDDTETFPYAVTLDGIQLQYNYSYTGKQTFYAFAGDHFTGEDGNTISMGELNDYFYNYFRLSGMGWMINTTDRMCAEFAAKVNDVNAILQKSSSKAHTVGLRIKYKPRTTYNEGEEGSKEHTYVSFIYTTDGKKNTAVDYEFDLKKTGSTIKLEYLKPVPTRNNTGEKVLESIPTLLNLLKALNGEYTFKTSNVINPTIESSLVSSSKADYTLLVKGTAE